ncbi:MAG: DUF4062 domain-containing protein [Bacteroidota bacterium]
MKIFISSPIESLKNERRIVEDTLNELGFSDVFLSEKHRSVNACSFQLCSNEIQNSELFILILGREYGWIPENHEFSVTELEYREAEKFNIERLVFLLDYPDIEELQNKFIQYVGDFFNGRFWGSPIKNEDELKRRIISDIPQHVVERNQPVKANKLQSYVNKINEKEIKNGENFELSINVPNGKSVFSFFARINYNHEAGATPLLCIKINNINIDDSFVINKPPLRENLSGKKSGWFSRDLMAWSLCYSPDFKSNYFHSSYKVINAEPYFYAFNIKNFLVTDSKLDIELIHVVREGNEAFKNSIIIENICFH